MRCPPSQPLQNMNVKIDITYTVAFADSPRWKVKADNVKTVDGTSFVKVRPYNESFCRFVVHDCWALPKRNRPSLAQCPGWKPLPKCRNDTVLEQQKDPEHEATSLFGTDTRQDKKKTRFNAAQLQEMRDNPEVMEFPVPGAAGRPTLNVSTLEPAHPCDDLYVPLDSDSIEHIVLFMRDAGVDLDNVNVQETIRRHGDTARYVEERWRFSC